MNSSKIRIHSIYPNSEGIWECVDESFGKVEAGLIAHNVTTFGYSYHESDQSGTIHADTLMPLLKKNEEQLSKQQTDIYSVLRRFKVSNKSNHK